MIDYEKTEEMINDSQQKQYHLCNSTFIPMEKAIKALWAILAVLLVLVGSSVGWALNESNIQSKHEVRIAQNEKDIESLQSIHKTMDTVVNIVKQIRNRQSP